MRRLGWRIVWATMGLAVLAACPDPKSSRPVPLAVQQGKASGVVLDDAGAPIAGAKVSIAGLSATTASDGTFAIDGVNLGSAIAEVDAGSGYHLRAAPLLVDGATPIKIAVARRNGDADVVFTGDMMFARRYLDPHGDGSFTDALAKADDPDSFRAIVAAVAPLTRDADVAIPNVETAIGVGGTPHPTKPFVIQSPPASVAALDTLGIDLVSLGNNHVYDYFDQGMAETYAALDQFHLASTGAGRDETQAYTPAIVDTGALKVGIASFCGIRVCGVVTNVEDTLPSEPPYQNAQGDKGGVARLSSDKLTGEITTLHGSADRTIAILHGGDEYVANPTPGQVYNAHLAIDMGADAVIAHHPHVLQPFESYKGHLIAYSLGDFVFDQQIVETWPGLLLHLPLTKDAPPATAWFDPIYLEGYVPYAATGHVARSIVRMMGERSAPLGVTVLEDGTRGRVYLADPSTMTTSDSPFTGTLVPDVDGASSTIDLESQLGEGTYLASVGNASGNVFVGRDLLRFGSFEHELAGIDVNRVEGFDVASGGIGLTDQSPQDGTRALELCRVAGSNMATGTYSEGRHAIQSGATYSVCGCWRGDDQSLGNVQVAFWDTLDGGAQPIASEDVVDGAPPNAWTCFCKAFTPPAGAQYVNLRVEEKDTTPLGCSPPQGDRCVDYDHLRLVEWQPLATLEVPNAIDFVRVDGGSAGPLDVTLRKVTAP